MERKTSQSEVQFGSLVDLRPEELEQACAATWKMSTPRPRSDSLRTAIEDLLKKISKQNRLLEDRLEELDKRLRTLEGESKHVGKYFPLEGGQSEVELKALETTGALAQPRAIDSSKIQPATARPKVRPTTYDGSSSWEDYAAQFQLVAEINNWDYVTKASYLAISLSGPALSYLATSLTIKGETLRILRQPLRPDLALNIGQKCSRRRSRRGRARETSHYQSWLRR
ncbi:hypothetical protein QZH41_008068 [Actinostola sp. cb2023]|nr:hypothetical protein QZH41_008068 [Actinostola sp. cb2023]